MSKSRIALAAAGAFAVALLFAFGVARATDPPGVFPKYLAAVAAPAAEQAERLQDYSPLYLALTRALAGQGYPAILAVQCLLLGVTAAAVAWAVGMLAGAGWGFAAGVGVATYRPFLVYCGVHEPETLVLAALAIAVVTGVLARRCAGLTALVAATAAAGALSAAALARPQHLVLVPVWAAWMTLGRTTSDPPARRRESAALVAVTVLVPAVVLGAFLLSRSERHQGLTIMNPGAVFYEGNGPGATGLTRFAPPVVIALENAERSDYDYGHVAYRRIATSAVARGGESVSPAVSNRYWRQLAWEGMRARPGRALARFARKAAMALGPYEAHDLLPAEQLDRRLRPRLPWGFVLPLLALPWIAFASSGRRRELAGPLLVAALAFAVQVALYASARQRLPLALALWIVGPALAADLVRGRLNATVRPALVVLLGVAVALGFAGLSARPALLYDLGWVDTLGPEPPSLGARLAAWSEGRGLRRDLVQRARRFDAGVDLARAGRPGQSLHVLAPLAGQGEDFTGGDAEVGVPEYWLARDLLALGRRDPAAQAAKDALAIRPDDPRIAALAIRLARPRGVPEPAAWRQPGVDPVSATLARANAAAADGDVAAARAILQPLAPAFPELAAASMRRTGPTAAGGAADADPRATALLRPAAPAASPPP